MNALPRYDIVITNHLRERFVERFSKESDHFTHLNKCRQTECEICRDLTYDLMDLVQNNKQMWDRIICAKLHDAKDVKIFQNDFKFMETMYRKYGYDRYNFLVESNILFVVNGRNIGLTCFSAKTPLNGSMVIANYLKRPKFNKCH
jgi:hypothetical protein